jgi:hypothetical protein
LGELFDVYVSNSVWFFAGDKTARELKTEQTDRQSQLAIYNKVIDFSFKTTTGILFRKNLGPETKLNKYQLKEFVSLVSAMPTGTGVFISSAGHIATLKNLGNGVLDYYDPEGLFEIPPSADVDDIVSKIMLKFAHSFTPDTDAQPHSLGLDIFTIHSNELVPIENYDYFLEKSLSNDKEAAMRFIQQSPCHFSELHVAVITNSVSTVEKLITKEWFPINEKNYAGKAALDIAVAAQNHFLVLKLLTHPSVDRKEANQAIFKGIPNLLSSNGNNSILKKYWGMLTMETSNQGDQEDLYYFISNCFKSAIANRNEEAIEIFLNNAVLLDSSALSEDSFAATEILSPIHLLIKEGFGLDKLIKHLKVIRTLKDCDGKTALDYATIYQRTDLVKALLAAGYDPENNDKDSINTPLFFNKPPRSVLDYAQYLKNKEMDELLKPKISPSGSTVN